MPEPAAPGAGERVLGAHEQDSATGLQNAREFAQSGARVGQVFEHPTADDRVERGSRADFAYGATDRVGPYKASWDGGVRRFAVNLLDAEESNIEPRPAVQIGAESVQSSATRHQPRELWKWAILAALGLLLLEWYVYNRRVFV